MADFYYGDICLPEVPAVDGLPYFVIAQDDRVAGYKYRAFLTAEGFKVSATGSVSMVDSTGRKNYLIAENGAEWVDAETVGSSVYSYFTPATYPLIFTNSDIYNGSTLAYAAMTAVSAAHSILTYLYNATAVADNPTEIDGTAMLKFAAADGGSLPDTVVVIGAAYTWDGATGTLALSEAMETVRVWVGFAEKYELDLLTFIDLAEAIRAKTGTTAGLTPDQMIAALRGE